MANEIKTEDTTQKIYSERGIEFGAFLGGPLVAGYFIAENFRIFNEPNKAKKTWIYSVIVTIALYVIIFLFSENSKITYAFIPLIYTSITYFIVKYFQRQSIIAHINSGGSIFNWLRIIVVGVIGTIVMLIPIITYIYITNSTSFDSTTNTYGNLNHQIIFKKSNISENEINQIAEGLTKTFFFDEAQQKIVFVKKVKNKYIIIIPVVENSWNNMDALEIFIQLKNDMQKLFPNNKIVIGLGENFEIIKKMIE